MSEIKEVVRVVGHVELFNPETNEILYSSDNMIVTGGKNLIASRLANGAIPFANGVAVGASNAPTIAGMTQLTAQVGGKNGLYSSSVSGSELTYTSNFTVDSHSLSEFDVKEVGLFDGITSASTMIARIAIPGDGVKKSTNETLSIRWKIRIE